MVSIDRRVSRFSWIIRFCLLTFTALGFLTTELFADTQAQWFRKKIDLTHNSEWGENLIKHKIEIFVEYTKSDIHYTILGERKAIIETVKIFMKDLLGQYVVGMINTSGITGASGEDIKVFDKIKYSGKILGLTEDILQYPTSPSLVVLNSDGTYRETDTVFPIDLNINKRTIEAISLDN